MSHSHRWTILGTAPLGALLLTALATAQVVVDPSGGGTHTDLQAGIDAAPPGGIVEVRGGSYGNIVVSKSLTIAASPAATLTSPFNGTGSQPAGIACTGTGNERLILANIRVQGAVNGIAWSHAGAGISIADFASVEAADCVFEGHVWTQLTGDGLGAPGIEVLGGAPLIHITRSTVRASMTDSTNVSWFHDGVAGIAAPLSTVVVTESTVIGGGGVGYDQSAFAPPTSCPCPSLQGRGGPGIHAFESFVAQSTVRGGTGAAVRFNFVFWGNQLDGPAYVGPSTLMPGSFVYNWDLRLNSAAQVALGFGSTAIALFGPTATTPTTIFGGKLWLEPQNVQSLFGTVFSLSIPNDPALIGFSFGVQFAEITPALEIVLGRPHLAVIRG